MSKITMPKPENIDKLNITNSPTVVTSKKYDLHGSNITVTYGESGADSKPYLNYLDAKFIQTF